MVYADLSSLYGNGEHYDNLYGGTGSDEVETYDGENALQSDSDARQRDSDAGETASPTLIQGPLPPSEEPDPEESLSTENLPAAQPTTLPDASRSPPKLAFDARTLKVQPPATQASLEPDLESEPYHTTVRRVDAEAAASVEAAATEAASSAFHDHMSNPETLSQGVPPAAQAASPAAADTTSTSGKNEVTSLLAAAKSIKNPEDEKEWWRRLWEAFGEDLSEEGDIEEEEQVPKAVDREKLLAKISRQLQRLDGDLSEESIEEFKQKYLFLCDYLKPTNEGDIKSTAKELHNYFNCRIYFLGWLPGILRTFPSERAKKIIPLMSIKNIIKHIGLLINVNTPQNTKRILDHYLTEFNLFKDILIDLFNIFKNLKISDNYIKDYISEGTKLQGLKVSIEKNEAIENYTYRDLLNLTQEIERLLLDYYLETEAAITVQEKWRKFKEKKVAEAQAEADPAAAADPAEADSAAAADQAAAEPAAQPQVEGAELGQEAAEKARKNWQETVLRVGENKVRGARQAVQAEVEDKVLNPLTEGQNELAGEIEQVEGEKKQEIEELLEDEKKLYLSVLSSADTVSTSLENDIPAIFKKINDELTPNSYDEYPNRKLDTTDVYDELEKFFRKIGTTNIEREIPLIKEIFSKINETKNEMVAMINKYKETRLNIYDLKGKLEKEIEEYLDPKEGRQSPWRGLYSGRDIIFLLKMCFEKIDENQNLLRIFEDRKYLDFKKDILKINKIIDLIKKYNIYIDSYLSIAKYIVLEKICNYLIRVHYEDVEENIDNGTDLLFKILIKEDIIKEYHLNGEIDYSLLFYEGIEKTLTDSEKVIEYSRIAPLTQKFKPTEVREGVVPPVAAGGGKRRRLTNKKKNRRERTNKKRRSIRKTNRRNTKKERTLKKRILKTERTLKKNTLKKRRV